MGCAATHAVASGFNVGDRVFYSGPTRDGIGSNEVLKFGASGEVAGQSCWGDIVVSFPGRAGRVNVKPSELSYKCPVIPHGYNLGESVYYGGAGRKYPNGDYLAFGMQGQIAGRACLASGDDDDWVAVLFPKHRHTKAVRIALLSREIPVIPGGYNVGDSVFWCGMKWTFPNGDKLRFGAEGKVAGRSCVGDGMDDERVAVNFPGNKGAVAMRLPEISRAPPEIPGGYQVGDRVFYAYPNWRAPDGFTLNFGVEGKLIGRSCIGDGKDDERAWVLFPGIGYGCIHLEQITRDPPVIPGGYKLGETVFYCGASRCSSANGDRLLFGAKGEVAGRACRGDVAVTFEGNADSADLRLAELSYTSPTIPGGYRLGELVYYSGDTYEGLYGERVTFGSQGQVVGCSCRGDGRDHERIGVVMPGNRGPLYLPLSEVSRETPPRLAERLMEQLKAATRDDDVAVLTSTHRSAACSGLDEVAEAALKAGLAQVEHGFLHGDLVHLAQVQSAAEDAQWLPIWDKASLALEEIVLPQVLRAAEASTDVIAQWAIYERAQARNFKDLAERAANALHGTDIGVPFVPQPQLGLRILTHAKGSESMLVKQMQDLVDETYTGWGGFGRDTRTRDRHNERAASRIEVVSVEQLQNADRYLSYCIRRELIGAELSAQPLRDWDVKTDRIGTCLNQGIPLEDRLNEHYLWHGTGPTEAKSIAATGFNMQQAGSGRGALFGRGLYFAESCLKADEYVKADSSERFPLILCRVTLGRTHYCDVEDPWELRDSLRASCRSGTGTYHSVLGDREKVRQTFREFIVFDSAQAYPEFIVWYVRK